MKFVRNILLIGFLALIILLIFNFKKAKRLHRVMSFFEPEIIHENFFNSTGFSPFRIVKKSLEPYYFEKGSTISLPNFSYEGKIHTAQNYIDSLFVTGLAVVKDNQLLYEDYYSGNTESTTHISWSVAKSFVSVLLGIAIDEGYIKSIEEPVDKYVPQLKGSGYEGIKIIDVLQMSSGIGFNEDYGDFWSDINRWSRGFALGQSQNEFAASLKKIRTPGTEFDYVSMDTHVLAMLVTHSTGTTLANYMQQKLWQPIGAEFDAEWIIDDDGMEIAFGCLNAALRDYLKFGWLVVNNGNWNGKQIISEKWLADSRTITKPHLKRVSDGSTGYGYQWWLPIGDGSEMMARGHSGQYIYINLETKTVIAQNSANIHNNDKSYLYSNFPVILAFFRAVNASL